MKQFVLVSCLVSFVLLSSSVQGSNHTGNFGAKQLLEKSMSMLDISTQPLTGITATTAIGNVSVNSLTGLSAYGICWSTNVQPTIADAKVEQASPNSTGSYTLNINGLEPNTLYYATCYAIIDGTVTYANTVSFSTVPMAVAPQYGDGSASQPYQIATLENLYWLSKNSPMWTKNFIQTANIDASSSANWEGGSGFSPIGTNVNPFNGQYNGLGFTISYLTINRSTTEYVGLFGYCNSKSILTNVGLTHLNISGQHNVGGLAGFFDAGTVSNCFSSGMVKSSINQLNKGGAGGLIGRFYGTMSNSYSNCTVSAKTIGGGLIASSFSANIYNCYASGSVVLTGTATNTYAGGLVGDCEISTTNGCVNNCYATGAVTNSCTGGSAYAGGLLGAVGSYSSATNSIQNCYARGAVSAPNHPYGFSSRIIATPTFSNCFFDTETTGNANAVPTAITGISASLSAAMKISGTYTAASWDFEGETTNGTNDYWNIDALQNSGYPVLKTVSAISAPVANTLAATDITSSDAVLNGMAIACNASTTISFEYGLTTSYGSTISASQAPIDGLSATAVHASLSGLTPNTSYHYRILGENSVGTTTGKDQTFTTSIATSLHHGSTSRAALYPNPATSGFNIEVGTMAHTQVELYNLNGSLMHAQTAYGNTFVPTSHLQPGIYIVKCREQVYKLVKK